MKTIIFITITSLILLTGCMCSNYPHYETTNYRKTNPDEIAIYPKGIDQDYEIICLVGADVQGDTTAAIIQIKEKASKQGADAIIHFKLNRINSAVETGGSGVAVKFIQNNRKQYSLR